jgi:anti-anti-sigma factor
MGLLSVRLEKGQTTVLHLGGEIDIATVDEFRDELEKAAALGAEFVVDMTDVTFIGVCGLRAMFSVARCLNGRGPLTVVHAPGVSLLVDVLGLRGSPSISVVDSDER